MQELIKIDTTAQGVVVSARDLHLFLEIKRDFTTWCKQMFEYGFEVDKDFTPISGKSIGGRPSTDYALQLDCAKEIAMLQRSDKGKVARQYFIACEKMLKETLPQPKSPMDLIAEGLIAAQQVIADRDKEIKKLAPMAEYTEKVLQSVSTYTATEIAKDLNTSANKLNALLVVEGVQYKFRDHYVLYAKYQEKGYAKMITKTYDSKDGKKHTSMQLEWTEYGRAFVHKLYNKNLSYSKQYKFPIEELVE